MRGSEACPTGAVTGTNDQKQNSYHGPCPPIGRHRYFHKLYALDITLPPEPLTKAALEAAMQGHVLAQAELMGDLSKGRSVGDRRLTASSLDCGVPTGLSGGHG